MNEGIKQRLQEKEIWLRGFYMLLFTFIYGFSQFLLFCIIFFQFVAQILTGEKNDLLLTFSQSLCTYVFQILTFLSFNSEQRPFPFRHWPNNTSSNHEKAEDA